jgi:hypothetical protein
MKEKNEEHYHLLMKMNKGQKKGAPVAIGENEQRKEKRSNNYC